MTGLIEATPCADAIYAKARQAARNDGDAQSEYAFAIVDTLSLRDFREAYDKYLATRDGQLEG